MALYEIQETPGKALVSQERLQEVGLGEGEKIDTQDKAKILVAGLRAKAKAEKRKVDFVVITKRHLTKEEGGTGSSGGTSIRLSEPQRKELAKFVGKHMWETGETISMGDAVQMLIDENYELKRRLEASDED